MPSIEESYRALPPVTRVLLSSFLLTGIIARLTPQLLKDWILFSWSRAIFNFEIYRLVLGFGFIGSLGFGLVISLYLISSFLKSYELTYYSGDNGLANLCFEIAFGAIGLLTYAFFFDFYGYALPGNGLLMFLIYLWSRKDPMNNVVFYSFNIKQWHFPFVLIVFQFALHDQFSKMDVIGILLGHLYHCLTSVFPEIYRRQFISVPRWWYSLFSKYVVSRTTPTAQRNAPDWRGRPAWQQGVGHRTG